MSAGANAGRDIRDAFFDEIYKIGSADPRVVVLTNDMDVMGLRRFRQDCPDRFVNMGVAEQNMINVAAGLASCGRKVVVYGIASFVTYRCFEQIKFNVCSMNLPVTIAGIGVGFSFGFDGPTHHGTLDLAAMRGLPEMTIFNPGDLGAAKACARRALDNPGPSYVRIDKGAFPDLYSEADAKRGYRVLRPLADINIISTGFMSGYALPAADRLKGQGIEAGVVDVMQLKPWPETFRKEVLARSARLVSLEENALTGGLGTALAELLVDEGRAIPLLRIASQDRQFLDYGNREWFLARNGLDVDSIVARIAGRHA